MKGDNRTMHEPKWPRSFDARELAEMREVVDQYQRSKAIADREGLVAPELSIDGMTFDRLIDIALAYNGCADGDELTIEHVEQVRGFVAADGLVQLGVREADPNRMFWRHACGYEFSTVDQSTVDLANGGRFDCPSCRELRHRVCDAARMRLRRPRDWRSAAVDALLDGNVAQDLRALRIIEEATERGDGFPISGVRIERDDTWISVSIIDADTSREVVVCSLDYSAAYFASSIDVRGIRKACAAEEGAKVTGDPLVESPVDDDGGGRDGRFIYWRGARWQRIS